MKLCKCIVGKVLEKCTDLWGTRNRLFIEFCTLLVVCFQRGRRSFSHASYFSDIHEGSSCYVILPCRIGFKNKKINLHKTCSMRPSNAFYNNWSLHICNGSEWHSDHFSLTPLHLPPPTHFFFNNQLTIIVIILKFSITSNLGSIS